ncbi:MAG: Serine/threonine-protein kinase PknB [Planctomycetota bacterium]|jgi:serine/threonine protein kinase
MDQSPKPLKSNQSRSNSNEAVPASELTSRIEVESNTNPPKKAKLTPSMILKRESGTLDPPQAENEIGRLREYSVNRILGEGGMGVVYLAWDSNLHRSVALKVMKRSIAENESSRQRFLLEARATAAIDHDHIVTIYQVGDHNNVPYLVMKYLEGHTLEDRLRKQKVLDPLTAVRIARQIADGLAAAHQRNLIHRDIKPSNIWLESVRSRVKILDFGLARIADSTDPNITQTGVILGTPAYMSPEQAAGLALDGRSDLFSLGTVLYRMTVGKPPFRGSNNLAILRSLSIDDPIPPHEANPQIPERLSTLILKLLDKEPSGRPGSARLLAEMLENLEQDLSAQSSSASSINALTPAFGTSQSGVSLTNTGPSSIPQQNHAVESNLVGVNLDEIVLAPLEEENAPADKKPVKTFQSTKSEPVEEVQKKPRKPQKAEVSPLLRKLAEQAAMQDEEEDDEVMIYDSRSATLNEWKRRNYWENFPWRPILFTLGFFLGVAVLIFAAITFWPMAKDSLGL